MFDSLSEPLGNGFRESIRQGAFSRSLASGADVRALLNHDPSMILGRSNAGTLTLREDSHGLLSEISLPDTAVGRDTYALVKSGDLSQMSFGFQVVEDAWPSRDSRELVHVNLLDVSVVTYPAYPSTEVGTRGLYRGQEFAAASARAIEKELSEQELARLKLRVRFLKSIGGRVGA